MSTDPPPFLESQAKIASAETSQAEAMQRVAAVASFKAGCYTELWVRAADRWLERHQAELERGELTRAEKDRNTAELERLHSWVAIAANKLVLT